MDKKISYCPRCDKYVERFVWFCPFCGGMVPKVSVWEKWDDAKRQEFFKDSPHYDPPRPTNDKAELEKAEAFDKQIKEELAQEAELAKYTPKCPVCGCPHLDKIGAGSKLIDVAMWGFASKKPGKQFKCKACGYEF
jgi:predicted RNA-binding Zn-ribbon protein involved in translation (DUF1610 family)|nr:MAG TPA: DNA-directed RNA polymerase II subunit [Bacteriophage sp.]